MKEELDRRIEELNKFIESKAVTFEDRYRAARSLSRLLELQGDLYRTINTP